MRTTIVYLAAALLCGVATDARAGDWHQWRGPARNGLAPDTGPLLSAFPSDGLEPVWVSEKILGDDAGGWGSVAVADGKAYVYSNWKYEVPIESRTLKPQELEQLGWKAGIPAELLEKVEAARLSEERARLEGRAVRNWINEWIKANLSKEQNPFRNACYQRLRQADKAIPAAVGRTLESVLDRTFATASEMQAWLGENSVHEQWRQEVARVVRTTEDRAHDNLFCLDAETGTTVWQRELPGVHTQYSSSSTPCVVGGRCYVQGSGGTLYCLDARTGDTVWQRKAPKVPDGNLASSFVVQDGIAVLLVGELMGLDAGSGETRWTQPAVRGAYASAAYWQVGGETLLVCNGERDTFCIAPSTGEIVWQVPAGGWSTPAIVGDYMAVYTGNNDLGLVAYKLARPEPERLWNVPGSDRGASPAIHDGHVYAVGGRGSARAICVALDSGDVRWEQKLPSTELASPLVADGKLLQIVNTSLYVIEATSARYNLLGKASVGAARCISPALVDGKVYLRLKEAVACYDLRAPGASGQVSEAPST